MKPIMVAAASADATDEQLVAAARAGSDNAFEALFRRYRERVKSYVAAMLGGDEGRAEDVAQEAFISALRSLRATDQAIAFKPWIYQIARNACIDHLRRAKRADEISIDSEDFWPSYEGRLSQGVSGTETAASHREDLENLRQAFWGLPDSQHRVLVLRELEGLSYEEIGRRMNLSAPAVESMLFRARRGLKGEYQEISTGARCRRMQAVMAQIVEGLGGRRDRRMLARHVRECVGCRREAALIGLGGLAGAARRRGRTRGALSRVAALLPIPPFMHRRVATPGHVPSGGTLAGTARKLSELGSLGSVGAEQAASAAQKAVAVIAALAVVGGGGIVARNSGEGRAIPATSAERAAGTIGGAPFALPGSSASLTQTPSGAGRGVGGGASPPGAPGSAGGGLAGGRGIGALLPGGSQAPASAQSLPQGLTPGHPSRGTPRVPGQGHSPVPSLPGVSPPGLSLGGRPLAPSSHGANPTPRVNLPEVPIKIPSVKKTIPPVSVPEAPVPTPSPPVRVPTPQVPAPAPAPSLPTPPALPPVNVPQSLPQVGPSNVTPPQLPDPLGGTTLP